MFLYKVLDFYIYFSKFKELVSNIEDDAQSVQKVKSILSTTSIISDLTFIRSHLSELPNSITKLEKTKLNFKLSNKCS